jgi:hypothetical protein
MLGGSLRFDPVHRLPRKSCPLRNSNSGSQSDAQDFGVHDPDGWIPWWAERHSSELFVGEFARFTLAHADSPEGEFGAGQIRFTEGNRAFEVDVRYVVEEYPTGGRVFHVLSVLSPGDPLPPWAAGS